MGKVLHAGNVPGSSPLQTVVSIYSSGDNLPLQNPANYLDRLYFDSRLDYLNIVGQIDVSQTFAYQAVTTNCGKKGKDCSLIPRTGENTYNLGAHGQTYRPAIAITDTDTKQGLSGNMFIQAISNTSFRMCWVLINDTYIYLKERWWVRQNNLPAVTKNFRIYIFNKPSV